MTMTPFVPSSPMPQDLRALLETHGQWNAIAPLYDDLNSKLRVVEGVAAARQEELAASLEKEKLLGKYTADWVFSLESATGAMTGNLAALQRHFDELRRRVDSLTQRLTGQAPPAQVRHEPNPDPRGRPSMLHHRLPFQ